MQPQIRHSSSWVAFTYISFIASFGMVALGILFLPMEIWIKGYFAMGVFMLIQSCITLTKTLRDGEEASRMHNRLEDAKAEELLRRVDRAA